MDPAYHMAQVETKAHPSPRHCSREGIIMKQIIGKWNDGNITLKDESVDAYSLGDIIAIDDDVWRVYGSEYGLKLWCITEQYEEVVGRIVWEEEADYRNTIEHDDIEYHFLNESVGEGWQ